jgi:iron-sulfur cluster insertion protein
MASLVADKAPPVSVTASAAKRVAELIAKEGDSGLMLRVAVNGGGCSGFQYGFSLDDSRNDDDSVIERDGVTVLVDSMSLLYLTGAEIDFVEDLMGSSFQIKNPNATSSCGCGTSFAV